MCEYDLDCVDDCHDPQDVDPYDDDPVRYNEIQCCMRDLGICSGSTGIAGPTDEELTKAYERCECLVDNDCGDYCN
jgi:hypothetical protein